MKSKTPLKIALDMSMTVLFLILLDAFGTGLVFHEIAGLVILVLFAAHLILNWPWVKNVTKNLFKPSLKAKPKLMYALNATLLICISTIIITGILISRVIFNFGAGNNDMLVAAHKWVSYACLGLFAIHIALHWRYILISVRSIFSTPSGIRARRAIQTLGAAALAIVVMYSLIKPGPDKVAQSATPPKVSSKDIVNTRKIDSSGNSETYEFKTREDQDHTVSQETNKIDTSRDIQTYEYKVKDDQDYAISQDTEANTAVTVSLADYLGNMFCTVCDKHCPLLSLKCDRGKPLLQAAKAQYQELYGVTASN